MDAEKLSLWIASFEKDLENVRIEYDAFFLNKKLEDYYSLKTNLDDGFLFLEILNKDQLPVEIIDRLTLAYLKSKPLKT